MAAHLRDLPRCLVCGAPATKALHNTFNALLGVFCLRHATRALDEFRLKYEGAR